MLSVLFGDWKGICSVEIPLLTILRISRWDFAYRAVCLTNGQLNNNFNSE